MNDYTLTKLLSWGPPSWKTLSWHALRIRIPRYFVKFRAKFCGSCWLNGHLRGILHEMSCPNAALVIAHTPFAPKTLMRLWHNQWFTYQLYMLRYSLACSVATRKIFDTLITAPKLKRNGSAETSSTTDGFFQSGSNPLSSHSDAS